MSQDSCKSSDCLEDVKNGMHMHTSPLDRRHVDKDDGICMKQNQNAFENKKNFEDKANMYTTSLNKEKMLQHYEECIDAVATAIWSDEEKNVNSNEDNVAVPIPNEAFPPQEQAQCDESLDSGETTPAHKTTSITKPCHVKKKNFLSHNQENKLFPKKLKFKNFHCSKNDGAGTCAQQEDEAEASQEVHEQPSSQGLLSSQKTSQIDPRLQLLRLQRLRSETGTWVQCSHCNKWRYLADMLDPQEVHPNWNCSMNKDEAFSSCSVAQVGPSPQEEEDMVHSQYAAGSLVWARLSGFPWWPAMVDDDPDFEQFYWLNDFSDTPTYYNVVFFDCESVTRAWVTPGAMMPFTGHEKDKRLGKTSAQGVNFHRRLEAARLDAAKAAQLSVARRLQEFSFLARYKGKIGKVASVKSKSRGKKPISGKDTSSSYKTFSTSDTSTSDNSQSDEEPVKKIPRKTQQPDTQKEVKNINKNYSSSDTDSEPSKQAKVVGKRAKQNLKKVPCNKTKPNKEKINPKSLIKKPNLIVKKQAKKADVALASTISASEDCIPSVQSDTTKGNPVGKPNLTVEKKKEVKFSASKTGKVKVCDSEKSVNNEKSKVKEETFDKKGQSNGKPNLQVSVKKNKISKFNAPLKDRISNAAQERNSLSSSKKKLNSKNKQENLESKPYSSPEKQAEKIDVITTPKSEEGEENRDISDVDDLKPKKRKLASFVAPKLKRVATNAISQVLSNTDYSGDISYKQEGSADTELNTEKASNSGQGIDSLQVLCGSEGLTQEPQQLENLSPNSVVQQDVPSPPLCGGVIQEQLTQLSSENLDFFRSSSPLFEMEE